jgi:hypothetical protein
MKFPLARRSQRSRSQPERLATGPKIYLTLAQEGELAQDQRSLPRKMFVLIAVAIYALAVPLFWAATADGASQGTPNAVLVKAADEDDDDDGEDDDGPDTTGNNDTGTGAETAANNTDVHVPGVDTGASTAGETDADGTGATEQTQGTGVETRAANTDRAGLHTGASTVGETDPGDHTGKTERR